MCGDYIDCLNPINIDVQDLQGKGLLHVFREYLIHPAFILQILYIL